MTQPLKNPREENGPSGYPRRGTNPAFDRAVDAVLERRKADLEQAEEFMRKMDEMTRTIHKERC